MRRSVLLLLAASCCAVAAEAQFQEEVVVARVVIEARVTDLKGKAVRDLRPEDFTVRVGGIEAVVDSVDGSWDAEPDGTDADASSAAESDDDAPPRARTVVVFVQTDFARNAARTKGQMKFRRHAEMILNSLDPEDRVAVFSFDSHLKFRSDLTTDRPAAIEAFRRTLRIDHPPAPPAVASPSLREHLDPAAMKEVTSSEAALRLVASALMKIEGPKILLLLGWGLGERAGRVVQMRREWPALRRELDAARVTIFALDTTDAGYHDLEFGLRGAAQETGGFYAKTSEFADGVVERFLNTIAGGYELTLRIGDLRPGTYPVDVRVRRRGVHVLVPASVVID